MRASLEHIEASRDRAETAAIIPTGPGDGARGPVSRESARARTARVRPTTASGAGARTLTERIINGNELANLNYLMLGLYAARSVGRIAVRRDGRKVGDATGFLVAPGVLMTNEHVLRDVATVAESTVQFRYELDARGDDVASVTFGLAVDPKPFIDPALDVAIVSVAPIGSDGGDLDRFGWLKLDATPGKSPEGEFLTIIQHPNGERKQICVRENRLLAYDRDGVHVTYTSDTVSGSSGSPVFNNSWDVVALHHSGVPKTKKVRGKTKWIAVDGSLVEPTDDGAIPDEIELQWESNEGVRASAVVAGLRKVRGGSRDLARRVLDAPLPVAPSGGPWPPGSAAVGPSGASVAGAAEELASATEDAEPASEGAVGEQRFVVPVEVTVRALTPEPRALEVSRDSLAGRVGYLPDFLGPDVAVPLPVLSAAQKRDRVEIAGGGHELRYGTYSVVMCASRALAYFSAATFDRDEYHQVDRGGWRHDPRIKRVEQVGDGFYGDQRADDPLVKDGAPFDRGHLTRRADTTWGPDFARNGRDSFYFPNGAPQHEAFNQKDERNGIWNRLEDWAAERGTGKLVFVNGPVFDGPVSKEVDGELVLQPSGRRSPDPLFNGVAVPKQFFKVIAYRGAGGDLVVQAFVVTQEDVLAETRSTDEGLTEGELRLYRVKMRVVEKLTGLDFGPLTQATQGIDEAGTGAAIERITSIEQL